MMSMMIAGMVTVLALIVTMIRINLRRCLGYATAIDLSFTALLLFMFHGTYSGIVVAAFSALFMSLSLSLLRYFCGYETARVIRVRWIKLPEVEWTLHAPRAGRASLVGRLARGWAAMRGAGSH